MKTIIGGQRYPFNTIFVLQSGVKEKIERRMKRILSMIICLLMLPQNARAAEIKPADIDYRYEGIANSESLSHGFVIRDQEAKKIRLKIKLAIPIAIKFSQTNDTKPAQAIRLATIEHKSAVEEKRMETTSVPANLSEIKPLATALSSEINHASCKKNIVFFPFNEFQIGDSEREQIKQFINCIRGREVKVTGYTCKIGSKSHNDKLAKARADSVARYLRQKGVIIKETTGRGQQKYISGVDYVNRRVEIEQK